MKAITAGTGSHSPSIDREAYAPRAFVGVGAFDMQSALDVQHSRVNTNSKSLSVFLEGTYTVGS